jgi:hypothetical protein
VRPACPTGAGARLSGLGGGIRGVCARGGTRSVRAGDDAWPAGIDSQLGELGAQLLQAPSGDLGDLVVSRSS